VAVRYLAPWQRVCTRHQRWMLTCGDGLRHHNLDLRGDRDIAVGAAAWPKVARTAAAAGADPGRVFALAHAVVCVVGWTGTSRGVMVRHPIAARRSGPALSGTTILHRVPAQCFTLPAAQEFGGRG
jgi:hypothetical protein